jgi:hypothetical protein
VVAVRVSLTHRHMTSPSFPQPLADLVGGVTEFEQRTKPGRVHERDVGQVDYERPNRRVIECGRPDVLVTLFEIGGSIALLHLAQWMAG